MTIQYVAGQWVPWPGSAYDGTGVGWAWPDQVTNNVLTGAPHASLLARIGNGKPFYVGNEVTVTVQRPGSVFLRINDLVLDDNAGHLTIDVTAVQEQ